MPANAARPGSGDGAAEAGKPAGLGKAALLLTGLCSLAYFFDSMVPATIGPLAKRIALTLSLTPTEVGSVFSANLVGQVLGLMIVPLTLGRLGYRVTITILMLGFGAAQAASGLATSRDMLLILRLVDGFFLGGALPICLACVSAGAPKARRGLAIMLLFTAYGLGAALAGVFASFFVAGEEWRLALGISGGACMTGAIAIWLFLREPAPAEPEPNIAGAKGARSLIAIVTPPLLPGTLLLWLMFVCAFTIYYCLTSWLPTLLIEIGRGPKLAAYAMSIFGFGGVFATFVMGPLIDRLGASRILTIFYGIAGVLLFAIGRLMGALSDAALLALLATCGFFMLGAYGGINVVLADYYPAVLRAVGVGWTKSVGRIGTVTPPLLVGIALSNGIDAKDIVSVFAVPALTIAVVIVAISRIQASRAAASKTNASFDGVTKQALAE